MQTVDFLRRILPPSSDGVYCWATPAPANDTGRRFIQHFAGHIAQVADGVTQVDATKTNTYYAMATFVKRGTRAHDNVATLKAFWLDIDCGPDKAESGKGYATKLDAMAALVAAVRKLHLPPPMIVDSGNGLHVYWPLTESVTVDVWKPVALRIIAALQSCDLLVDYQCVSDESRILRPAGTHNWKDPTSPRQVVVRKDCPDFTLSEVADPVSHFEIVEPAVALVMGGANDDLNIHYDSEPADANRIADECAQVAHMRDTLGNVSEPEWRNCLGVLKHCEDGEAVAQRWSAGHPDYSEKDTARKLRDRKAPTRCETFARDNKSICMECVHRGNITSPIQLGRQIIPVEVESEALPEMVDVEIVERAAVAAVMAEPDALPSDMAIMYKWKNGKMFAQKTDGMVAFCGQHISVVSKTRIANEMCMLLHVVRSTGAQIDFALACADTIEPKTLLKTLAKHGISAMFGKETELVTYLKHWFAKVSLAAEESRQHTHFGWQESGDFLVGNRLYRQSGDVETVTVSPDIAEMARAMAPRGDAGDWSAAVNALYGGEDMAQYHFIIGVGFGAPLMQMTGINGVTFSALSTSGFGKTACELAMLAVWGAPSGLIRSFDAMTLNSIYEHIAIMHSLPVVIDEVSKVEPKHVTGLAYDISAGQGKQRLGRDGAMRNRKPSWHTIVQTSSNYSLWEKLGAGKAVSDAQWVRMLEFRMLKNFRVGVDEARTLMHQIEMNSGCAGDVYMQYVVTHKEQVQKLLEEMHRRIDNECKVSSTERFWSAGVASTVTGLILARKLGLIDVDPVAVMRWAVAQVRDGRRGLREANPGNAMLFRAAIQTFSSHCIITDSLGGTTGSKVYARPAHGELWGRCVVDDGLMWITQDSLRQHCITQQFNYREAVDAAREAGLILGEEVFALGAGTEYPSAAVACFKLDWKKLQEPSGTK